VASLRKAGADTRVSVRSPFRVSRPICDA
jgi:hypothetical protein